MGIGHPCPLVRNDIVTPHHLFIRGRATFESLFLVYRLEELLHPSATFKVVLGFFFI